MSYFNEKDIEKTLTEYKETKEYFDKNFIDEDEKTIINDINSLKEKLNALLAENNINELILIRERLNRCLESIAMHVYKHSEKADWVYIWRKNKMANEWTPLKESFKKTAADTEKILEDRYSKERIYSMFEQKRTDYLLNFITVIQNDLRTIQLKIEDIAREHINIGREEKRLTKQQLF